jgi:hypothetical protein
MCEDLGQVTMTKSKWTLLDDDGGETSRLIVPGGYLYRTSVVGGGVALAFVPRERQRQGFRRVKVSTEGGSTRPQLTGKRLKNRTRP